MCVDKGGLMDALLKMEYDNCIREAQRKEFLALQSQCQKEYLDAKKYFFQAADSYSTAQCIALRANDETLADSARDKHNECLHQVNEINFHQEQLEQS